MLLVVVACLLPACATVAPPVAARAVGPHADPLVGLPGGEVARATVGAYGFADGLGRIEPVMAVPPEGPVGRLAVSRAILDALLFGELTQNGPMLDALVERDAWTTARALLTPEAPEPVVAAAQAEGLALIDALRARSMDAGYHGAIQTATTGVWEVEARLARLLDLEEAMLVAGRIPGSERARTLGRVLGSVPPPCLGTAPLDGVEPARRDVVLVGHCGPEALGWPESAEAQLYHPDLGAFTVVFGRGNADLRAVLARSAHPLVADARGDVEALGGRLAGLRVPVMVDVEAQSDFPFVLPTGSGEPLGLRILILVAVGGELRVAVPPMVSFGPAGARFLEEDVGFAFPGALTAPGQLAGRLGEAEDLLESGRGPAVFLPAKMRLRSASQALRAVRGALPLAAQGELVLATYEQGAGLRGVGLRMATGKEAKELVVPVAIDGTIRWPEGDLDYVILAPDPEMTVQVFLRALSGAQQRVGTVLVLL